LPDGSRFDVVYDASAPTWSGTLTVPAAGTFTASASAVFKLLSKLDAQYRASLSSPEASSAPPPG
jgi:hypothetical protein